MAEELAALPNCDLGIFYDNASPSLREVRGRGLVQTVVGEMKVDAFTGDIQAAFLRDLQQVNQARATTPDAPQ